MEPTPLDDLDLDSAGGAARDVREYLEIPFRYQKAFWLAFLGVLTFSLLLAAIIPRKYRSGTLILVENAEMPEYFVQTVATEGVPERLQTIREVVLSRTNLEAVIEELDPYPEARGQPRVVVVERMRRAVDINVRGRDSFSIEYVNTDPFKAMMVTNMLARRFIADAEFIRDDLTRRAYDFVESNLEDARRALEEREAALRQHKQRYWGSLPEQLESNLRVLQQLQLEQQTLAQNSRTLQERRATLERALLEGRRTSGAGLGPEAELARLKEELAELHNRYTDQHPDVVALRLRIEQLESRMADGLAVQPANDPEQRSLFASLKRVESDLAALEGRRDALDQRIAEYQRRVEQTPRAEQELAALTRDYQQLKDAYSAALRKQLEADSARKLERYWKSGYFRILDPAYLPRRPIRAYGVILLFLGVVGGLGAGLGATLLADFFDRSVKTERDLERLLPRHPVLLTVPHDGIRATSAERRA